MLADLASTYAYGTKGKNQQVTFFSPKCAAVDLQLILRLINIIIKFLLTHQPPLLSLMP